MIFALGKGSLDAVCAHARDAYPEECCGLIVERDGREEVVRASNIQNELNRENPERYPRSAATAYTMGPEAAPVLIGCERGKWRLVAIYHSHPDREAYFSAEDRRQACGAQGDPVYPQAAQIVVSVRGGEVRETKAFLWDPQAREFAQASLEKSESE